MPSSRVDRHTAWLERANPSYSPNAEGLTVLEPEYGENVVEVLDKIEYDLSRKALWNAICDAIDLVRDQPDSAEARKDGLVLPSSGTRMWMVPIRCNVEDEDWVLVRFRDGDSAVIQYVGPRGFRSSA